MPKVPFWVFILIAALYFTAVRIDTMDIDASQYAEMSREMLEKGDYLHMYDRGMNYLDKPPFLFWTSAISMKVFGVNNFGYKLPSILFALLAIFATYRLTRLLYNDITARMAALVLATCQGMFLMTNDIRCDTILMAWVITAIWLIQEWIVSRRLLYLLAGCAAIAFGMMTKGPIALMVPAFCFVSDWVLKRQWKNIFQPAYILGIIVMAILLIPMSYGLYDQFDKHPEVMVNGSQGVSGLRFFYWSQSFGRITGESPWKNAVDISFLLMNMLWSFLPWIFLFLPAIIINVVQLVKQKFKLQPQQEWITTGGFLITYIALGSSAYQLPHYIFIAFPLAAIITARFIYDMAEQGMHRKIYNVMRPFMGVLIAITLLVVLLLIAYVFPAHPLIIALWVIGFSFWLYLAFSKAVRAKLLWLSAAGMIIINIFLTNYVYYTLLQYQVGSQIGRYIHSSSIPAKDIIYYKMDDPMNSVHFYAQQVIPSTGELMYIQDKKYLITMDKGLQELQKNSVAYSLVKQGVLFKVSELTPPFLNPATRSKEVKPYYLLKLK